MKKYILNSFFLLIIGLMPALGQTEKGSWLIGGYGNIDVYNVGSDYRQFYTSINPQAGYFLVDNFALGTRLPLSGSTSPGFRTYTLGIGPFIRYYVGESRIRFFGEAQANLNYGYQFNEYAIGDETTNELYIVYGAGLGLAYFITPRVGLEAMLGYTNGTNTDNRITSGQINLNAGFQIYLPPRQR
jgi:hypothetical protein